MKAYFYCRVAHDDSFSLERQAEELRRYAEQAGYTIVGAAAEHVSGMTLDRPALQEVMEAVLAGSNGKGSVGNAECIFTGHTMAGGFNGVSSPGYDQIIFGNDPVSRLGVDGEGSASVEGQIGLGKDDGV